MNEEDKTKRWAGNKLKSSFILLFLPLFPSASLARERKGEKRKKKKKMRKGGDRGRNEIVKRL